MRGGNGGIAKQILVCYFFASVFFRNQSTLLKARFFNAKVTEAIFLNGKGCC